MNALQNDHVLFVLYEWNGAKNVSLIIEGAWRAETRIANMIDVSLF